MSGRNRLFRLAIATAVALLAVDVFSHWFCASFLFRTVTIGIGGHEAWIGVRNGCDPNCTDAGIHVIPPDDRRLTAEWRPVRVSYVGVSDGLDIPLWNATAITIIIAAAARFRRRRPQGCCNSCGYDLTGNVSGCCPECGEPAATGDPLLPREKR